MMRECNMVNRKGSDDEDNGQLKMCGMCVKRKSG